MGQFDINSAEASDLSNAMTDYSVDSSQTDAAAEQKETKYSFTEWSKQLGFYRKIPELRRAIDAKATWTVGKGYIADDDVSSILDKITGFGKDTFNTILENAIRTYQIGGDFFAEIVKDKNEILINLKPLDTGAISIVVDGKGIIIRYEQDAKVKGKKPLKIQPEDMFHLPRNRVADEIHGQSLIPELEFIILAKNEAMDDQKQLMHRHVKPLVKFILDTDDTAKIATFKAKADKMIADGENLYLPKDTAEHEIISVPANATLNPLPWIQYLDKAFYEACGVPQIIVGGSGEFTEASAKIAYLAFQQTVEEEQLFIEEQVGIQLGMEIDLEFPASLENELLSDQKKDGPQNIDPSETTAGQGQ